MSDEKRAYIDTSALAKWYLNEENSETFETYLRQLDVAVISSLTQVEMRSLLSRRRRMGEISSELESVLYAAFIEDVDRGWLQLYPVENKSFMEAVNLINRYPEYPLRTLDALHLAIAADVQVEALATADSVMADVATAMSLYVRRFQAS